MTEDRYAQKENMSLEEIIYRLETHTKEGCEAWVLGISLSQLLDVLNDYKDVCYQLLEEYPDD